MKGEGDDAVEVSSTSAASDHVIAHVFKITNDPFVGKLSIFRIYQGTIRPESQLLIGDARKPFKVGHLFQMPMFQLTMLMFQLNHPSVETVN